MKLVKPNLRRKLRASAAVVGDAVASSDPVNPKSNPPKNVKK